MSALEIEFTQKTDDRLQRIIDAYPYSDFGLMTYLTADPGLAAKLTKMITYRRSTEIRVRPWMRLDATNGRRCGRRSTPPAARFA